MRGDAKAAFRTGIIMLSLALAGCRGDGLEELQGNWQYTHSWGGRSTFLVSGDKVIVAENGAPDGKGIRLVVDPRPTPRHLDLIPGDDKDQPEEHLMGIYELQGDTLRIALPPDDKAPWPGPRPTSFTNENTWVLVRVK